jgi:hypothetical protein
MPGRADELPSSIETLDELAGFDVLPESHRVRDDAAIPDGCIIRRSGWLDTSSPPAPPRDAMDARRLERTARWAGARPGLHLYAALAWRAVRRFRGDSRAVRQPSWSPRRMAGRPRACLPRRSRRRRRARPASADDPDSVARAQAGAARRCSSWR